MDVTIKKIPKTIKIILLKKIQFKFLHKLIWTYQEIWFELTDLEMNLLIKFEYSISFMNVQLMFLILFLILLNFLFNFCAFLCEWL
jgi:hypothetical protein